MQEYANKTALVDEIKKSATLFILVCLGRKPVL